MLTAKWEHSEGLAGGQRSSLSSGEGGDQAASEPLVNRLGKSSPAGTTLPFDWSLKLAQTTLKNQFPQIHPGHALCTPLCVHPWGTLCLSVPRTKVGASQETRLAVTKLSKSQANQDKSPVLSN